MNIKDSLDKLKLDTKLLDIPYKEVLPLDEVYDCIYESFFYLPNSPSTQSANFWIVSSKGITKIDKVEKYRTILGEIEYNVFAVNIKFFTDTKNNIEYRDSPPTYSTENYGKTWLTTKELFYGKFE